MENKFETYLKAIAEELLQTRLDGAQMNTGVVWDTLQKYQPESGLNIDEWKQLTDFILKLEPANVIPEAKKLSVEYGLEIKY